MDDEMRDEGRGEALASHDLGSGQDGWGSGAERRPQVLSGEMGVHDQGEDGSGRGGAPWNRGREMPHLTARGLSGGVVARRAKGVRGRWFMSALGIAAVLLMLTMPCAADGEASEATNEAEALEQHWYSQSLSVTVELRGIAFEDFGEVRMLFR